MLARSGLLMIFGFATLGPAIASSPAEPSAVDAVGDASQAGADLAAAEVRLEQDHLLFIVRTVEANAFSNTQ
ncbi:MAG: hypothetical protein GY778_19310, partial [bacterium]|nr:hypothetical protein [bacterium]